MTAEQWVLPWKVCMSWSPAAATPGMEQPALASAHTSPPSPTPARTRPHGPGTAYTRPPDPPSSSPDPGSVTASAACGNDRPRAAASADKAAASGCLVEASTAAASLSSSVWPSPVSLSLTLFCNMSITTGAAPGTTPSPASFRWPSVIVPDSQRQEPAPQKQAQTHTCLRMRQKTGRIHQRCQILPSLPWTL